MVKKKYESVTEHILTIEIFKEILFLGLMGLGLLLLGIVCLSDLYPLTNECINNLNGCGSCESFVYIGIIAAWFILSIIFLLGFIVFTVALHNKRGMEIKVRRQI